MLRLQAQFPSTVSTVYRTSEKLVKAPRDGRAAGPPGPRCLLCMCALDVDTADSATAFGAQTLNLSQTQPPAQPAEARVPTGPCSSAGMDGAQGCCQAARPHGRGDPRPQVVQHLCYGCRVTVRDLPSLDPLPPYILAEAQLRSQRHRLTLYCGAPGGAFPAGAPGGCFPLSVSPRALPQTQEALVQEAETYMPVRAEPAASALDESRPPGPPSCGAGCCGWAEGT